MKAIETKYNGYRFRSRLEARWAVFFDELGIEYQYEPEGYNLGSIGWYLPDFYLPSLEIYCEAKGPEPTHEEMVKCIKIQEGMNQKCVILRDIPNLYGKTKFSNLILKFTEEKWHDYKAETCLFNICEECGHLGLFSLDYSWREYSFCPICGKASEYNGGIEDAYDKARQARFEHGEHP